ncbi:hypothetical protein QBC43DRAFT_21231 [Cladorrhinum sp. PSN259]|nr:hypothetical protein QBC43DRAFT_21231 [Cladorrhinum sp. PSN259]
MAHPGDNTLDPVNIHQFLGSYQVHARYGQSRSSFDTPRTTHQVSNRLRTYGDSDLVDDTETEVSSPAYTASPRAPPSVLSQSTMRSHTSTVFSRDSRDSRGKHSVATSAPPRRPPQPDLNQVLTQQPPIHNQSLWCEFSGLLGCRETFRLDEANAWIQHHLDHLGNNCPMESMCWFCDNLRFTAHGRSDAYATFWDRMEHILDEIRDNPNLTVNATRPDFNLVNHAHQTGLLPERMYEHAVEYNELPPIYQLPGGSSSSRPLDRQPRARSQHIVSSGRSERRKPRDRERDRGEHVRTHY